MEQYLSPFCERESATKWLSDHVAREGVDRAAMYCLHITNSLIQDGKNLFERIPRAAFRGLGKGGRRNVEASLLLRAGAAAGGRNSQGELSERTAGRLVLDYARRDGCWSGNAPSALSKRFKKLTEGGEAEVFFDGSRVVKFISNVYFDGYTTALDRISLHNFLSPATGLTVLGFGANARGECGILVSQPFIKGSHVSEKEIQAFMEKVGFTQVKSLVASTEYTCGDYYVGDMHDENVIRTPGGHLAMIDIDGRLNTPELKCGGHYVVPGLAYSTEAVRAIDGVIRKLVPEVVSRTSYVQRYGSDDNQLREQLAKTGRYNGSFVELDAHGQPQRFTLRVDPENKARLLKLPCESISKMLALDKGYDAAEKAVLSKGLFIRRGNATYAFDADAGRVKRCIEYPLKKKRSQAAEVSPGLHK